MKSAWGKMRALLPVILCLTILLASGGITYGLNTPNTPMLKPASPDLPLVGTYDNLLKLLEKCSGQVNLYNRADVSIASSGMMDQAKSMAPASSAQEYSDTNVQVQGVDEADLVKTDGTYIYKVNKDRVLIIKAKPADQMQVISTIQFDDIGFTPVDLYLDADILIVIGTYNRESSISSGGSQLKTQIYPHIRSFQFTRALIYNIENKNQIRKVRELELEGNYLSSRKVNSSFYLLTNKYLNYYNIQNQEGTTPLWRDTVQGNGFVAEKLAEIHYFPDCISPSYLMIAGLDLKTPAAKADIHTYLGGGDQVYASQQNLYVAVQQYDYPIQTLSADGIVCQPPDNNTQIYKFALLSGEVQYLGIGKVPGKILNQFSMDEDAGYFRIATTTGDIWSNDQYISKNNVYILNGDLQVCGKLENIAPGERIYSTRFVGDRAYMVTFKQVDPFFVLDLKNPQQPKILGKLKIPGYSDYLQPYDENHIIGFGKDTVETKGWNNQTQAFYQGMKAALFDVTDVTKPVEMSQILIGDRGTDSELLHNHKALLFSPENKLLAFPVTVMELQDKNTQNQTSNTIPDYGAFSYQGAYIYQIDLSSGLQLRGRITHLNSEDYLKAGDQWYDPDKIIERVLYIDDNLYTLSPTLIKAHKLTDLEEIKSLSLN